MNSKIALGQVFMGFAAGGVHYAVSLFLNANLDLIWAYYAFFMLASLLISWTCSRYHRIKPDQVGLVFIGLMFAKMLVFTLVFSPVLFTAEGLNLSDKMKIIAPFAFFLILEVLSVYRVLNPSIK